MKTGMKDSINSHDNGRNYNRISSKKFKAINNKMEGIIIELAPKNSKL